jgi:hypothetical protein
MSFGSTWMSYASYARRLEAERFYFLPRFYLKSVNFFATLLFKKRSVYLV